MIQQFLDCKQLQKLLAHPEYLSAVQQMQNSPTAIMQKYKNNPEFVHLMLEYMKTMGEHILYIKPLKSEQQQQQPKIFPISQTSQINYIQTQEEKAQYIIENDKEVIAILQDTRVQAFIEFLQRTGKVDFKEIAYKDLQLMQKLQVLIQKGVLNVQIFILEIYNECDIEMFKIQNNNNRDIVKLCFVYILILMFNYFIKKEFFLYLWFPSLLGLVRSSLSAFFSCLKLVSKLLISFLESFRIYMNSIETFIK
ncbi:unnamed protein product [Paramecium sonneborni]|uniref:Uncharacterized protein n=1 Tax=Paramecium sonneborni TaxID=65129 RepID=A0A8S1N0I0_9CILI|nr:unnamed protein product [Paramecium sonneborni]